MPNYPQTPKTPYKTWERFLKQRPAKPYRLQTHIPFGIGKHRKSFGHVKRECLKK